MRTPTQNDIPLVIFSDYTNQIHYTETDHHVRRCSCKGEHRHVHHIIHMTYALPFGSCSESIFKIDVHHFNFMCELVHIKRMPCSSIIFSYFSLIYLKRWSNLSPCKFIYQETETFKTLGGLRYSY